MNANPIDQFQQAGPRLRESIVGLSAEQLKTRPGPGEWSIHELIVHLADSDAIAIDRMKRVITEDVPKLLNADETAYVSRLHSHEQSIEDALDLFEISRRQFSRVLRRLSADDFQRTGLHNVSGEVTLQQLVEGYTEHFDHHFNFLIRKRHNLESANSESQ